MAMMLPDDRDVVIACTESIAYYDERLMAWLCGVCDAVLKSDGDCPRCDGEHVYTVDVILHGTEPYPCNICGEGRQSPNHIGASSDPPIPTPQGQL